MRDCICLVFCCIFQGLAYDRYPIKRAYNPQSLCRLEVDAFYGEREVECEKILSQNRLNICADDFKRLSSYYFVCERSSNVS